MRAILSRSSTLLRQSTRSKWRPLVLIQRQASNGTPSASVASRVAEAADAAEKDSIYGAKSTGLGDESGYIGDGEKNDWSKSYHGLSVEPFSKEVADILLAPIDSMDVEMKPGKLRESHFDG